MQPDFKRGGACSITQCYRWLKGGTGSGVVIPPTYSGTSIGGLLAPLDPPKVSTTIIYSSAVWPSCQLNFEPGHRTHERHMHNFVMEYRVTARLGNNSVIMGTCSYRNAVNTQLCVDWSAQCFFLPVWTCDVLFDMKLNSQPKSKSMRQKRNTLKSLRRFFFYIYTIDLYIIQFSVLWDQKSETYAEFIFVVCRVAGETKGGGLSRYHDKARILIIFEEL